MFWRRPQDWDGSLEANQWQKGTWDTEIAAVSDWVQDKLEEILVPEIIEDKIIIRYGMVIGWTLTTKYVNLRIKWAKLKWAYNTEKQRTTDRDEEGRELLALKEEAIKNISLWNIILIDANINKNKDGTITIFIHKAILHDNDGDDSLDGGREISEWVLEIWEWGKWYIWRIRYWDESELLRVAWEQAWLDKDEINELLFAELEFNEADVLLGNMVVDNENFITATWWRGPFRKRFNKFRRKKKPVFEHVYTLTPRHTLKRPANWKLAMATWVVGTCITVAVMVISILWNPLDDRCKDWNNDTEASSIPAPPRPTDYWPISSAQAESHINTSPDITKHILTIKEWEASFTAALKRFLQDKYQGFDLSKIDGDINTLNADGRFNVVFPKKRFNINIRIDWKIVRLVERK